jgi:hypothetical protein
MNSPLLAVLCAGLVSILPATVLAETLELAQVTSSYPQGYRGALKAELAEDSHGALEGISYSDSRGTELRFTVEELRKGAVLIRALGKDLLKLRAPRLDERSGGEVELIFYRKFFSGEDRRVLWFELTRGAGGRNLNSFGLQTNDSAGRDAFGQIHVKLESGFIPSGIERIELSDEGRFVRRYDPQKLPPATRKRQRRLLQR